jgi:hypothetical protein
MKLHKAAISLQFNQSDVSFPERILRTLSFSEAGQESVECGIVASQHNVGLDYRHRTTNTKVSVNITIILLVLLTVLDKTTLVKRPQAGPLIQVPTIITYRPCDSLVNVAASSAVLVPDYEAVFEITDLNITALSSVELLLPDFVVDGNRNYTSVA